MTATTTYYQPDQPPQHAGQQPAYQQVAGPPPEQQPVQPPAQPAAPAYDEQPPQPRPGGPPQQPAHTGGPDGQPVPPPPPPQPQQGSPSQGGPPPVQPPDQPDQQQPVQQPAQPAAASTKPDASSQRWAQGNRIHDEVLGQLTRAQGFTLMAIYRHERDGQSCITQQRIGEIMKINEDTVKKAVGVLVDRGLLEVVTKGGSGKGPNVYRVLVEPVAPIVKRRRSGW